MFPPKPKHLKKVAVVVVVIFAVIVVGGGFGDAAHVVIVAVTAAANTVSVVVVVIVVVVVVVVAAIAAYWQNSRIDFVKEEQIDAKVNQEGKTVGKRDQQGGSIFSLSTHSIFLSCLVHLLLCLLV